MDFATAIRERRSVREFRADPVKRETLKSLIDTAVQAPSAMDEQPWHFTVITDKALLSRISREAKAHQLAAAAQESHIDHVRTMLSDAKFDIFYDAPALIVISAPKQSRWATEDCALAAENLMLAAQTMNLGTCWIGFAQDWLDTADGHAAIDLGAEFLAVAPIIVGVPKAKVTHAARREPKIDWIGK